MNKESLTHCFSNQFKTCGDKTAIYFHRGAVTETQMTYMELEQDSNQMANFFKNMGVEKGDRVILFQKKSLLFIISHLAIQKIGAISVPLNPGFKKSELSYFLDDADPCLVITGKEEAQTVKNAKSDINPLVVDTDIPYQKIDFFRSNSNTFNHVDLKPDNPGVIIYTSGTTGRPKGAVLTQMNLIHDAENIIKIWEITKSDVLCHALPLFHVHGLCFALHTAFLAGAGIVLTDGFSPDQVTTLLENKKGDEICTIFMAVPAMYGKLMDYIKDRRPNFDHMRLLTSGSAPLLVKDFNKINKVFGKEPVEREGMSETGMNFSNPVRGKRKPGSVGVPLPGLEVRLVDPETFQDVNLGEEGEIWLKGPGITPGYWRKPQETEDVFVQGWFRSGDLGKVDMDGYYYLTDRIKHIIISGGENISPKEIESVINQLDDVIESSVVGLPDDKWGEKVVAVVVQKKDSHVTGGQIQTFCKKHLHDWKCPKEIIFVNEIPKNTMGKVLKEEVKKQFKV